MTSLAEHSFDSHVELSPLEAQTLALAVAYQEVIGGTDRGLPPATLELILVRLLGREEKSPEWASTLLSGGIRQRLGLVVAGLVRHGLLELQQGYVATDAGRTALEQAERNAGRHSSETVGAAKELVRA